jgi:hypothetical protein
LRSQTIRSFAEKHFGAALGALPLKNVTAARIESVLRKREDLSPESLNHLRAFAYRLFGLAERRGLWSRSHGSETTKGDHADLLPIAEELRPYLEAISKKRGMSNLAIAGSCQI